MSSGEMEMWAPVPNTDGKIEVSTMGRVRSLLRDERILKAQTNRKGYAVVRVTVNRRKFSIRVHRAVAEAFIPNPNGLPQVNHKDGNKGNNAISNLEWVSDMENKTHAIEHGLWEGVFAASARENERRKKPIRAINLATRECIVFPSMSEAERAIGTRHINECIRGKRSHANGWTFSYAEAQRR